jgi:hypothetical protein
MKRIAVLAAIASVLLWFAGCIDWQGGDDCDGGDNADDDAGPPPDDDQADDDHAPSVDDDAGDDTTDDDDDDDNDTAPDDDDNDDTDDDDDNDDDIFADDDDDSGPPGVTIEQVDGGQVGQSGTAVAIALNGDVLLAAARGRQLMIYTLRGGEKIGEEMAAWNAFAPSMALDGAGNIYVVFQDRLTRQLRIGAKRNGAWSTPVLDAAADTGEDSAITVDAAGCIHVAYRRGAIAAEGELRHAEVSPNGAVRIDFVDANESPGRGIDIVSDPAGNVYISYITADHIRVADNTAGAWTIEGLVLADYNDQATSIALAPDGEPWVAYAHYGSLQVSRRSEGRWLWEAVGDGGSNVALTFGLDGRPWIAHSDGEFRPASTTKIGGEWVSGTIEDLACSAGALKIAVDAANRVHVVHHDYLNSWLKYSVGGDGGWSTQIVDDAGYAGECDWLALDAEGAPHISYGMFNGGFSDELRLAARHDGQWRHEIVETASSTAEWTALAMDEQDNPHVAYQNYASQSVEYAWLTGAGWHFQTIETYAYLPTLGLDAAGSAHVAYLGQGGLRYANNSDGAWARETIEDIGGNDTEYDSRASLAVDGDGRPHVSFYNFLSKSLRYASRGDDGWDIQDVDADRWAGVNSSLALDGDDRAHLAYFDQTNMHLKYAAQTDDGWNVELIDGKEWSGYYPALALDAAGGAHIVYLAAYDWIWEHTVLRYATNAGGAWRCGMVDGMYNTGSENSIQIDAAGWAHVGYYNWWPVTLFHAYFPAGQADEECNPADAR